MKAAYILVEGELTVQILRCLLSQEILDGVKIFNGGRASATKSLARSVLVEGRSPAAVILNARATDPELVREKLQSSKYLIEGVAANTPVEVIFAVPTIEIIFFEDISILERIFDTSIPESAIALARFDPQGVLQGLYDRSEQIKNTSDILAALSDLDIQTLQKAAAIEQLLAFLRSLSKTPQEA